MSGERPREEIMPNKRKRSEVWEHFDKTPDGQRAICKYCSNEFSGNSKGGTSHLKRHLNLCKKRPQGGVYPPPTLVSGNEVINIGLTCDKTREGLVKKAIVEEIPFASSDCKKLWHNLVGPMDVEKETFACYELMKGKLAIELKNLTSRISFSFEVLEKVGYISITAHFIDEDFKLVRKLIGFKKLNDVSSESCIADALKHCISDWKLGDKIFSFISKEYYWVEKYLREEYSSKMWLDGKFINVFCCKSILSKFCFYKMDIFCDKHKDNIEKLVRAVITVPSQLVHFNAIAEEKGLAPFNKNWLNEYAECCRNIGSEDPEHWRAAAKLSKEVLMYKDVFNQYANLEGLPAMDHNGGSESENLNPAQLGNTNHSRSDTCTEAGCPPFLESDVFTIDWEDMEFSVQDLDLLLKIVDRLSASNHPTSNLCFPNLVEICKSEMEDYDCPVHYLDEVFKVANVLDPRYKLIFSEYYWSEIHKVDIHDLNNELVKDLFYEYANEGIKVASPTYTEYTNKEYQGSSSNFAHLSREIIDGFSKYTIVNANKSELNKYLGDKLVDLTDPIFNLLGWWKQNRSQYPVLSKMARDILAVPACTYSMEGTISSDFEAFEGLSPELVEAVVCSKDWILSDVKSMPEPNI